MSILQILRILQFAICSLWIFLSWSWLSTVVSVCVGRNINWNWILNPVPIMINEPRKEKVFFPDVSLIVQQSLIPSEACFLVPIVWRLYFAALSSTMRRQGAIICPIQNKSRGTLFSAAPLEELVLSIMDISPFGFRYTPCLSRFRIFLSEKKTLPLWRMRGANDSQMSRVG